MIRIRIATRGSDLALTQSGHIAARIERELGVETELVVLRTSGDRIQDRSLAQIGGKGLGTFCATMRVFSLRLRVVQRTVGHASNFGRFRRSPQT